MNRSILASAAIALVALPAVPALSQSSAQTMRDAQQGNRRGHQSDGEGQQQQRQTHLQITGLSRQESDAMLPAYQAVQSQDWAAATAALPAAQAAAQSPTARYVLGQLELQIARGTNNSELMLQAVNQMIDSGAAPADQIEALQRAKTSLTAANVAQSDPAAAETQLAQLLAADANNIGTMIQLAEVKERLNKHEEAIALFQRAIAASTAAGQAAPQDYYRRALAIAYGAHLAQPSLEVATQLIAAYPTGENWRDSLRVYRSLATDRQAELDLFRLMHDAGALASEAEYVTYAETANRAVALGEVKSVLDEAFARNMIQASNATSVRALQSSAVNRMQADRGSLATEARNPATGTAALRIGDAYFGYGQYAEAAQAYRTALQKGGQDANLVNLRLGEALARAGQRAEAETAFRAVTGPHQPIAAFWLLFLAHPPQGQAAPAPAPAAAPAQ